MRIAELWRYPVKSTLGERLERAAAGERGLEGDRAFALVDAETGLVVSAKNPRRWARMFELSSRYDGGVAEIAGAGVRIRTDDPDAPGMLSSLLGRTVTVASLAPPDARAESEDGGVVETFRLAGRAPAGTFFDSSPVHIVTTASLRAFAEAEPDAQIDARRFRPNIVLDVDGKGFVENGWSGKILSIGDVRIELRRQTARCVMVTLPQDGLRPDPATLRAVAAANMHVRGEGEAPAACAGIYGVVATPGVIEQGAPAVLQ